MQKSGRLSREEFSHLRQKRGTQLNQQRKQAYSNYDQYNIKPWMRLTDVNLKVRCTPETMLGLRYGFITDMPQEFLDSIQDPIPEERCNKAQQLLVQILGDYFNIPKETQPIYDRIIGKSNETSISKTHIIRSIVWKYYGHEPPEQNEWYLRRSNKKKTLEQFKQIRESLQDKHGVEKYYTPDLSNPIDQEILCRISNIDPEISMDHETLCKIQKDVQKYVAREENKCRNILTRRLSLGVQSKDKKRFDAAILSRIEKRCIKHNMSWNDVVRKLFCIEFNIKQPNDTTNINQAPENKT